ncbi:AraC family transcriptional regulator [Paraburkholderia antibiotica]|uniref:Helix-turn-helix transcriptional regulator n=1 Tax=Paraburkholderia antibiotica TaxID=2728839 RepID=A0A7X9ZXN2_9BURK|nr:AraC family transcriptional regulator [Paraburkholderia antibiotica]NML30518.1 helix-turn-helix transcriptional regulator [Paraburkholderia antibiotica]
MNLHDLPLRHAPFMTEFSTPDVSSWTSLLAALSAGEKLEGQSPNACPGRIAACRLVGGGIAALSTCEPQSMKYRANVDSPTRDEDISVVTVLRGKGSVQLEHDAFSFETGDVIFRRARTPAAATLDEQSHLLGLRIPASRLFGSAAYPIDKIVSICSARNTPSIRAFTQYAEIWLAMASSTPTRSRFFAEQALISLLTSVYLEASESSSKAARSHEQASTAAWGRLLNALQIRLCDPELSADSLASTARMSKRYMHRLFEKHGLRYGEFLLQRRLEHARDELEDPRLASLKIGDIAYRAGFNDAGHFSRTFRKCFHVSPGVFRAGLALEG